MAQQAQQQQPSGSSDNSFAPVWITILIFITAFFIWKIGHEYIVAIVFYLNVLEGKLVSLFIQNTQLANDIYVMQTIDPSTVQWDQMMNYTQTVGDYIRYPVMVILILLAGFLYQSNITLKFRKTYDMKRLRIQEQYNWPSIMPIIKLDLANTDINQGPWATALTPMEFARKYDLLKKNDILLDKPLPGQDMTAAIKRGDAKRVLTLQLGPYWDGFDKAPPYAKALAAVFIARMNRDRTAAMRILDTLNKGYREGRPDYSVATSTLKKYQHTQDVQEITHRHAYLLTVMASLLQKSREDGVAASADFLWLKPVDRRLWYMLNCVGRQTPFAEVAGPFSHWKAEIALGRRSLVPMIDEAIKALDIAIKEIKLSPKELQELEA